MRTNFCGFNFRWCCCPQKLVPDKNLSVYGNGMCNGGRENLGELVNLGIWQGKYRQISEFTLSAGKS